MVAHEPTGRIDRHPDDLLRVPGRDRLDLHPALAGRHDDDTRTCPVDQHAEIELAGDIAAGLDIDPLDLAALGPGLMGDQGLAQQGLGSGPGLAGVARQLDSSGLAAPAGMGLRDLVSYQLKKWPR